MTIAPLVLEVLEVCAPRLDLLREGILVLLDLLGVPDLHVVIQPAGRKHVREGWVTYPASAASRLALGLRERRARYATSHSSLPKTDSKVKRPYLLVRLSGSEWFSVDVDDGLLPQVDPVDELLVAVLLLDRLQALVEALQGRLAGAEAGESGQLKK